MTAPAPTAGAASSSLSHRQVLALRAVLDGFLPPTLSPESVVDPVAKSFWEDRISINSDFIQHLTRIFDVVPTDDTANNVVDEDAETLRFQRFLAYLSNAVGTSLVFGRGTLNPFTEWSIPERTNSLQTLRDSPMADRRRLFRQVRQLVAENIFAFPSQDTTTTNPFWSSISDRSPGSSPPRSSMMRTSTAPGSEEALHRALIQAAVRVRDTQSSPMPSSSSSSRTTDAEYDVIIVGATLPGFVAATLFAQQGYQVVVIREVSATPSTTKDGTIQFLQPHSSRYQLDAHVQHPIQQSVVLPLPAFVRDEWVQRYGLEAFTFHGPFSQAWKLVLQRCAVMVWNARRRSMAPKPVHVSTQQSGTYFSRRDDVLLTASKACGLQWETIEPVTPQQQSLLGVSATDGPELTELDENASTHSAWSVSGMDGSVFLREAVEAGVDILDECRLERVETAMIGTNVTNEAATGTSPSQQYTATGVMCRRQDGSSTFVKARKAVVVTGDAVRTPMWLLKSGFRNRLIGKHLKLQPMTTVLGFGRNVRHMQIALPTTTRCTEYEYGPQQDGYGASIECARMHLSAIAAAIVWDTPQQYKERLLQICYCLPLLIVQRDHGEGVVRLTDGGVEVDYKLATDDKESFEAAMRGATRLLNVFALQSQHDITEFGRSHDRILYSNGATGTCRMSVSDAHGVVDPNGQLWGCENLFVMDASILPSPTAVNPTLIVMAVAWMLTSRLISQWRQQEHPLPGIQAVGGWQAEQPITSSKLGRIHEKFAALMDGTVRVTIMVFIFGFLLAAWFLGSPWWLANFQV